MLPNPFAPRVEKALNRALWAYVALAALITLARNI